MSFLHVCSKTSLRQPLRRLVVRARPALLAGLSALASLMPSATAHAQSNFEQPSVPVVTLLHDAAALQSWVDNRDWELREARDRLSGARAATAQAGMWQNPTLDAAVNDLPISRTNPQGLSWGQSAIYSAGLSQTLDLSKRGPRQRAATFHENAVAAGLKAKLLEQMTEARSILARAVHFSLRLAILEQSVQDAENVATLERTRFEQQALSGMDYDRLLLELRLLEADLDHSRAAFQAVLSECAARFRARCEIVSASERDLVLTAAVAATPAIEAALQRRPDLAALDAEQKSAFAQAELARRRAIPDPTLRLGYVWDESPSNGSTPHTLGLAVALPLPLFDQGQHDSDQALAFAAELGHSAERLRRLGLSEVEALFLRKASLERTLTILDQENLPRSVNILQAAQQAFHRGGVSMTDLLLARRTHVALKLNLLDQRLELFEINNQIYRLLGLDLQQRAPSNRGVLQVRAQ